MYSVLSENRFLSKLKDEVLLRMIMYQGLIHSARMYLCENITTTAANCDPNPNLIIQTLSPRVEEASMKDTINLESKMGKGKGF